MNITRGLAPFIVNKLGNPTDFGNVVQQIIHGLNTGSSKWQKKMNLYTSIIFDLCENDSLGFKQLRIQDIVQQSGGKSGKTRMSELMDGCRALRRSDDIGANDSAQ